MRRGRSQSAGLRLWTKAVNNLIQTLPTNSSFGPPGEKRSNVSHRRLAEEPTVFAIELRSAFVADLESRRLCRPMSLFKYGRCHFNDPAYNDLGNLCWRFDDIPFPDYRRDAGLS
jgi:hypothetical protein